MRGLLVCLWAAVCEAQVRRPATVGHSITFEDSSTVCDFAQGAPISTEYAARLATFSGPGFGSLNGGVIAHACALSSGQYPPLGNISFAGSGFLAFSTLHVFHNRAGKPVAPETVRFDVRVTNLRVSFSGIDNHEVQIQLWSGPALSYNDRGTLLASYRLPMTAELQAFDLIDDRVSCCHTRTPALSPVPSFLACVRAIQWVGGCALVLSSRARRCPHALAAVLTRARRASTWIVCAAWR